MAPSERHFSRVGAIAAVTGVIVYAVSAGLHPWTPPHETEAAFADYAVEPLWALYHVGELLGILLMGAAVLSLAWRLRRGAAGVWAVLGAAAMVVCASLYAVFVAVDGVALGIMVDRWAGAGPAEQDVLYETAFAVRQIEGGLFSLQWLMFGIVAGLFAVAFFVNAGSAARGRWSSVMGWISAIACVGGLSFGVVQAQTGYSDLSMSFQTGIYMGGVWVLAAAWFLYRNPEHVDLVEKPSPRAWTRRSGRSRHR
ncbi:hypothetical protein [Kocuria rhizosphaericola]|uniref:hypothetical protein n=1 Tax=Kocuria rhizosphaericola TaxID=3376284 RepID=UPI0037A80C5A